MARISPLIVGPLLVLASTVSLHTFLSNTNALQAYVVLSVGILLSGFMFHFLRTQIECEKSIVRNGVVTPGFVAEVKKYYRQGSYFQKAKVVFQRENKNYLLKVTTSGEPLKEGQSIPVICDPVNPRLAVAYPVSIFKVAA